MNWINIVFSLFLFLSSIFGSFFIAEYSYRIIVSDGFTSDYSDRTMLFEAGNNFVNYEGYFRYYPNAEIRSLTLYSRPDSDNVEDISIEYDYIIETNNAGLVMHSDLAQQEDVIFIIGDSFTEGQGSTPWFYDLEATYDDVEGRIVNLGILGTGPMQWETLASAIIDEYRLNLNASIINIIPQDMGRTPWTFNDRELNCLYLARCDYHFGFQGYHFSPNESHHDIKYAVLQNLSDDRFDFNVTSGTLRYYLKRSRLIFDLYQHFLASGWFNFSMSEATEQNAESLLALRDAVGDNFIVNVVSQKGINSQNFEDNYLASWLISFLEANEITYVWCDIPEYGYHVNDGHPNEDGYKVLRQCTSDALSRLPL